MATRTVQDLESGHELILDPEIPGQIGWEELLAIARLAKRVPPGGIIVETGSLYGRSAYAWAKNAHPSVTVFCVDPWIREPWIIELVEKKQGVAEPFSIDAFRHFTRECPNIRTIQGKSPKVVEDTWKAPIDLYFDDADHDEPGLSKNRDFWVRWIKPGGFFCADEYDAAYPACLRKTYQLASKWAVPVRSRGLFCWLQRPG